MQPLEQYLHDLRQIRATGAHQPETSFYGPLEALLNSVGSGLKPRVRCVMQLADRGAGRPDGGLYTQDQFEGDGNAPLQNPARGAVEVKPTGDDAWTTARSDQVTRYWQTYRQVLVTNYWDFLLLGKGPDGKPAAVESYRLAEAEAQFWTRPAGEMAAVHGQRFIEFLKRVLLHAAPIATAQELAFFLASYARDARARVDQQADLPALADLRGALEGALGIAFQDERGGHFFRSTLVQTLFYGLFSAWVLWHKQNPQRADRFEWRAAMWLLHVPAVRVLFEQVAVPSRIRPLGLLEVLERTAAVLNRVDRAEFFAHFADGQAVQYFYEPFLEAFDPQLRKDLGVWYTPPEIVRYMVARVDRVLREELDIADGLADPAVYVLDPCCGTGAYLVEVLKTIAGTLAAKGGDALTAHDLKQAAMRRVFGFEIMPAPFVVAHLQLGLLLQNLGAPLAEEQNERAAVYLTNALTGWEPPQEQKKLAFPELEAERDAARRVKRKVPILVVLGNPPYNGFAGVAVAEERDLSNAYRATKQVQAPQGQGLNDLYVRFFRMAERRIVEFTGRGVVCFISNYSWLDGLSFTGMRERYLEAFDAIWIDNLHGDRIISEYAPDGQTSETVFAMAGNSPGIKIGTAIALLARRKDRQTGSCQIRYQDMEQAKAAARRAALLASLGDSRLNDAYSSLVPALRLGLPFKPRTVGQSYLEWPRLPDLFPVSFPGVKTSRDDFLVDIDRDRLLARLEKYFDPAVSHEDMRRIAPSVMESTARFKAAAVRDALRRRGLLPENVVRYCYRPFDVRWLYWEPETDLLDRKREDYFRQVFKENLALVTQMKPRRDWSTPQLISQLGCIDLMDRSASVFPMLVGEFSGLFSGTGEASLNLSPVARTYLSTQKSSAEEPDEQTAELLWMHALAVLHAPAYRAENAGALRQDWPRIPLPKSRAVLDASAALGRQIAALLDTETPLPGVIEGDIRPELRNIGVLSHVQNRQLDPAAGDLQLTAGWGHAGKGGVTMPGKGRSVTRDYTPAEQAVFDQSVGLELALACLGETTRDVYLNDAACWRNVPERVWTYTIGGYQVIKKWLSYRERAVLGRSLTPQEAREVTNIARRIAALLLLEPALDASYKAVVGRVSEA